MLRMFLRLKNTVHFELYGLEIAHFLEEIKDGERSKTRRGFFPFVVYKPLTKAGDGKFLEPFVMFSL